MCLIVDNCVAHRVLLIDDPDYAPVRRALEEGRNTMVYGGHLLTEYRANNDVTKMVIRYGQAGRARRIPDADVEAETDEVEATGICVSNDPHIIALARVSGARVLCSTDQNLHRDFTNSSLITRPKGKVYQYASQEHLLNACRKCSSR